MLLVVTKLRLPPPVHLLDGPLHGARHPVGVQDHLAVDVARGAAGGLDQGRLRAQEALLVGVEDRDQGYFRQIQSLAQQIDTH